MPVITNQESLFSRRTAERREAGRSRRAEVPLEAHAEVPAATSRPDPVNILTTQDAQRQPLLVPIRHGRMSATAFTFYRGAAGVMASDLAAGPSTDLRVQLCGDAHLSNFGIFHGPDRRLVFDLNDFDETLPGPFEWDLKRLVASVTIAGRDNELSTKKTERATRAAVRGYRTALARAAEMSPLDVHYYRLEVAQLADGLEGKARKRAKKTMAKAKRKNSLRALDRLTEVVEGQRRIVPDPPLITRVDDVFDEAERQNLITFLNDYVTTLPLHRRALFEHYRIVDMAHKVVGVGSVGTRCLVLLTESGAGDPLFLQLKEATTSVLENHLDPSRFEQAGERVVMGQTLLQSASDVFLGWSRYQSTEGRTFDFYVRQLWDGKRSADISEMGGGRLARYAEFCGGTLALAHARSSDAALLAGYVGGEADETFDHVLASFASAYADLNERDHATHQAAIESGRIEAIRDV